ncbi:MAG: TetR/AcrR family transcriptional regulator [Mycobacterium sp.]
MGQIGLRQQKKADTRAALSTAALDLATQHGLHAVTIDAIAERAHVSSRTFRNYFSSKEDAILALLEDVHRLVADTFDSRDPDEHVLDSLAAAVLKLVASSGVVDQTVSVVRLVSQHPALIARTMVAHDTLVTHMVSEIARRTGTDPHHDLYPRLVYHAGTSVTAAVFELLAASPPPDASAEALVRNGFAQLRSGLPGPDNGRNPQP